MQFFTLVLMMLLIKFTSQLNISSFRDPFNQVTHIYSDILFRYKCTLFFTSPRLMVLETFFEKSYQSLRDVLIFESFKFTNQTSMSHSLKYKSCIVTWVSVLEESQINPVMEWMENGRKIHKTLFPRIETDYFVIHILSNCEEGESNLLPEGTSIPDIRYGIVVKCTCDPQISYLCNYCPYKKTIGPGNAFEFLDFTTNLESKTMRVVLPTALDFRVVTTEQEDGSYGIKEGSYGWLAELLAAKMNFTATFFPSSNKGATGLKLKNGTWTGASGDLIYERADFVVSLILSASRFPHIDYSMPIERLTMTFATATPKQFFNWLAVVKPFTASTYGLIAFTIIILTVFFTAETYFKAQMQLNVEEDSRKDSHLLTGAPRRLLIPFRTFLQNSEEITLIVRDLIEIVSFLIASCLTESYTIKKHTRILCMVWLLAAIVLSTAYQSKLFYFMAFPIYSSVPDAFDDLAHSDYRLTLWSAGGSSYAFFRKGTSVTHRKIFARITTERNIAKCLFNSLHAKSACIIYTEMADFTIQTELSDRFGRTPFRIAAARTFPFYLAVAMKKHSILIEATNRIVLPAVEANLHERMVKQHVRQVKHRYLLKTGQTNELTNFCSVDCEHDPLLGNLIGVFYFLLGGWFISVVVAAVEALVSVFQHII